MSRQKRKHPDTDIEQAASAHSRRLQPGTGSPMPKPPDAVKVMCSGAPAP